MELRSAPRLSVSLERWMVSRPQRDGGAFLDRIQGREGSPTIMHNKPASSLCFDACIGFVCMTFGLCGEEDQDDEAEGCTDTC